ncbi:hypothetical protein BDZ97DRAFT_2076110 [Flammula alnicola]|nr:hypothetical protein BDZ97DRAFT_2076110 [Flammula alnicola]
MSTTSPLLYSVSNSTPESRSRSPIDALSQDLLWKIFLMNANMEEDYKESHFVEVKERHPPELSALTTTVQTSHVCRYWRELILGWPSVWCRVIDFDALLHRKDWWKNEVMLRTQQSPLSVRGTVNLRQPIPRSFFISLLNDNWARIRTFDVMVQFSYEDNPSMWQVFSRPAPQLESFKLTLDRNVQVNPVRKPPAIVFSNYAPLLREFGCHSLDISFCGSALSHIGVLELSGRIEVRIAPSKLIETLQHMVFLESLTLDWAIEDTWDVALKVVNLPRLKEIAVHDCIETAAEVLEHINAARTCSLYLKVWDHNVKRAAVHRVVSRYSQNYFSSHTATWLSFHLLPGCFRLAELRPSNTSWRNFVLNILQANSDVSSFFWTTISPCHFTRVTYMEFHAEVFGAQAFNDDLTHFLSSFSSLEVLVTSVSTLFLLLQLSQNGLVIFPSLKTLRMTNVDCTPPCSHATLQSVTLRFLNSRRSMGASIDTIDLSMLNWASNLDSVQFLEEIPGLSVMWNRLQDF